jgi:hypothetical protein
MFLLINSLSSSLNLRIISLICSFTLPNFSWVICPIFYSLSGKCLSTRRICLLGINSVEFFLVTLLFPIYFLESFDWRLFFDALFWSVFCWLTILAGRVSTPFLEAGSVAFLEEAEGSRAAFSFCGGLGIIGWDGAGSFCSLLVKTLFVLIGYFFSSTFLTGSLMFLSLDFRLTLVWDFLLSEASLGGIFSSTGSSKSSP